jgi:hypothetical protein
MTDLGRMLVLVGVALIVAGGLLWLGGGLGGRIPFLGRLPGDIHIQRENWSFYVPLTTSIVLSIVLSLILAFLFPR